MTGAMGDRVPPQNLTDEQEARLERLQDKALETVARIQPQDVYYHLALADWALDLVPGVPLAIPDHWDVDYEDLSRVQRDAWGRLTSALRELLEVHIDDDAIKAQACGED